MLLLRTKQTRCPMKCASLCRNLGSLRSWQIGPSSRYLQESSNAWNNAGTGHSALCEPNYTPTGRVVALQRVNSHWFLRTLSEAPSLCEAGKHVDIHKAVTAAWYVGTCPEKNRICACAYLHPQAPEKAPLTQPASFTLAPLDFPPASSSSLTHVQCRLARTWGLSACRRFQHCWQLQA